MFEETKRISDPVPSAGMEQNLKDNEQHWNLIPPKLGYFLLTRYFFSILSFSFLPKIITVRLIYLQNKLSLIKLCLINYINKVRIVIDYIGHLKICFLTHVDSQLGTLLERKQARFPKDLLFAQ